MAEPLVTAAGGIGGRPAPSFEGGRSLALLTHLVDGVAVFVVGGFDLPFSVGLLAVGALLTHIVVDLVVALSLLLVTMACTILGSDSLRESTTDDSVDCCEAVRADVPTGLVGTGFTAWTGGALLMTEDALVVGFSLLLAAIAAGVGGLEVGLVAATTANGTAWAGGALLTENALVVGFCLLLVATAAAVPGGFKGLVVAVTADGVDLGADGATDFTA